MAHMTGNNHAKEEIMLVKVWSKNHTGKVLTMKRSKHVIPSKKKFYGIFCFLKALNNNAWFCLWKPYVWSITVSLDNNLSSVSTFCKQHFAFHSTCRSISCGKYQRKRCKTLKWHSNDIVFKVWLLLVSPLTSNFNSWIVSHDPTICILFILYIYII